MQIEEQQQQTTQPENEPQAHSNESKPKRARSAPGVTSQGSLGSASAVLRSGAFFTSAWLAGLRVRLGKSPVIAFPAISTKRPTFSKNRLEVAE
jgi:hypothetical protein